MIHRRRAVIAAGIAAFALLAPGAAALPDRDGVATLSVDAARSIGTLKPLRGVNGAPDMGYRTTPLDTRFITRPVDLTQAYRDMGVTLVRTHDALGAGDIDTNQGTLPPIRAQGAPGGMPVLPLETIFPDPAADPDDATSYRFAGTDRLIRGIRAAGADVLFRVGRTGGTTAAPPDPARYARIVRHVVLHYNKGWANGSIGAVRYWELWNEPDFGPLWWRGTPEQYFELYSHVARAVKAADPAAMVGGPAIAADVNVQPYREGFLDYVRAKRLPLDFFSWHHYAEAHDPMEFVTAARTIRGLLDSRGFGRTMSVLDEWNSSVLRGMRSTSVEQAAFVVASRIYMQDAPIDLDGYYRPDGNFGADGRTPNTVGQALVLLGRMARTPQRLATTGGDDKGLAIQAGRSADGRTVQVLVANYEIPVDQRTPRTGPDTLKLPGIFDFDLLPRRAVSYRNNRGYTLTIGGLRPGVHHTVERYRISNGDGTRLVDRIVATGPNVRLEAALPAPGIDLIVVHSDSRRQTIKLRRGA